MNHELIYVGEFPAERNEALELAIEAFRVAIGFEEIFPRYREALTVAFGPGFAPQDDRLRAAAQAVIDCYSNGTGTQHWQWNHRGLQLILLLRDALAQPAPAPGRRTCKRSEVQDGEVYEHCGCGEKLIAGCRRVNGTGTFIDDTESGRNFGVNSEALVTVIGRVVNTVEVTAAQRIANLAHEGNIHVTRFAEEINRGTVTLHEYMTYPEAK